MGQFYTGQVLYWHTVCSSLPQTQPILFHPEDQTPTQELETNWPTKSGWSFSLGHKIWNQPCWDRKRGEGDGPGWDRGQLTVELAGQLNHLLNHPSCPQSIRVVVNELLWLERIWVAARFNWQAPETACNSLGVDRGECYRALEVGARIEEERRQIGILTRKTSNLISLNLGCKISSVNIECSVTVVVLHLIKMSFQQ